MHFVNLLYWRHECQRCPSGIRTQLQVQTLLLGSYQIPRVAPDDTHEITRLQLMPPKRNSKPRLLVVKFYFRFQLWRRPSFGDLHVSHGVKRQSNRAIRGRVIAISPFYSFCHFRAPFTPLVLANQSVACFYYGGPALGLGFIEGLWAIFVQSNNEHAERHASGNFETPKMAEPYLRQRIWWTFWIGKTNVLCEYLNHLA